MAGLSADVSKMVIRLRLSVFLGKGGCHEIWHENFNRYSHISNSTADIILEAAVDF